MKYLKLFENFEDYNPYDLTVMFPNERLKLFIEEIKKPTSEQNLNLVRDLINLGNINTQDADDKTPLHWAANEGSVEIARILIDAGADLNVQDNLGWTPLHGAAEFGRVEIVRMLIDAGADKTILNNDGLRWDQLIDDEYYDDDYVDEE